MIFKSSFAGSPDVSVIISGASVDYTTITSVSVDVSEHAHDVAILTFNGLVPKAITDYVGAPVFISIATSPAAICSFYGYIAYNSPQSHSRAGLVNNSPFQTAEVVCFGASYEMKSTKNKAWTNATIPSIVDELAMAYNMSYSVPEDHFTWSRIVQTKQSDWSLLSSVVSSLGYGLTINGTHIHVYDPYKAIARQLPYIELKTVRGAQGSPQYVPGALMEFNGTFGDITPDGTSNKFEFVGIDNAGNVIKTDTDDMWSELGERVPSRFTDQITTNVSSIDMLSRFAKAKKKNTYPYNAVAITTGIAEALPGSVAKLDNYDSNFDGYWLVRGVKHTVTRSNFVTELKLSTDSTSKSKPTVNPSAAYNLPPLPRLTTGDRWESSMEYNNVYV